MSLVLVHNDCPHCGALGWFPHGVLQHGVCPVKNAAILSNRGLTGLSAVDGIVTHDNQIAKDMTIAFAQTLPLTQQIIDTDTLISDEKTKVDKVFAGASLAVNIFAFFTLGARGAGASGAYEEVFQAGSVTKHARPMSNAVNAVEAGAQFSGGRTARNVAVEVAHEKSAANAISKSAGIPHAPGHFTSTQAFNTGTNRDRLRASLLKAGKKTNPSDHAHHIVPGLLEKGQDARDLLDKYHIDINGAENGVFLTFAQHIKKDGLHSGRAIDAVTRRLNGGIVDGNFAESRKNLIEILNRIGFEIMNDIFKY